MKPMLRTLLALVIMGTSISLYGQNRDMTFIFKRNETSLFVVSPEQPVTVNLQISGIPAENLDQIQEEFRTQEGVVAFTVSNRELNGIRSAQITFAPGLDFPAIRDLLKSRGVKHLNIEENVYNIDDAPALTTDQMAKLVELNQNITNIETKIAYVMEDPNQKAMAEQNGWFTEAMDLLAKAKEAKSAYLQSIK